MIFDHLQKTAGQAVNAWLANALGPGCVTPNLIGEHRDLIRRLGGPYSIISAHVVFQNGDTLDTRYQYVTVLREPIDRALSWIFFLLKNVDPDRNTTTLIDGAKRFVASDGEDTTSEFLDSIRSPYVEHFCRIGGHAENSDSEKLAAANAALNDYDVVGLYEQMPAFVADFGALLGIAPPERLPHVNVTRSRPKVHQISDVLRSRLEQLNRLDIQFYADVSARIANRARVASAPASTIAWARYDAVEQRAITTPDICVASAALREGEQIDHGSLITFDLEILLTRDIVELEMGIHIFDADQRWAFGINSTLLGQPFKHVTPGSYRVSHHLVADLPSGRYTAGFAFAERLAGREHELFWQHSMCAFEVRRHPTVAHAGYAYLPAELSIQRTGLAFERAVITQHTGSLQASVVSLQLTCGEVLSLPVTVTNLSGQSWLGDVFRPVKLSYHWLNAQGDVHLYEGLRSSPPVDGFAASSDVPAIIQVVAPEAPGHYRLILTLVQEQVCWFEENGFEASTIDVSVSLPS
ncbi:hypothetical protein BWP39_19635 [Paraburkholderia acidicola]|uniref:Wzt C-terminal domain-containing protein n=1 Tax=Paraburkholderia acidicola TaxID=1912599 RepID=A0A2A4EM86_9BURK|nr:hypothetical protein BWP39_19635 [Paraburkholderia acidicola]